MEEITLTLTKNELELIIGSMESLKKMKEIFGWKALDLKDNDPIIEKLQKTLKQ